MILKKRLHNSRAMISTGVTCFAVALVAQRFIHPAGDFWQGFVAGVSGLLIGLSIFFNVRGLALSRRDGGGGS
jgi:multisubunit Na+/H+ antiporter MnhB subunit